MKKIILALVFASAVLEAQNVQTDIKIPTKGEKTVEHIIQTKNSRTLIAKTYALKYADPYEIKTALEAAVGARTPGSRIPSGVECIKYEDGSSAVVVSAEAYRFEKQSAGMSIDELIASLDQPGASSASNGEYMLYFPQNISADEAAKMIRRTGLQTSGDPYELTGGTDSVRVDRGLNAVLVKTSPQNRKRVSGTLEKLDSPVPQAMIAYRFYRLSEAQFKGIEAEFEMWKNSAGSASFKSGFFPGISSQFYIGDALHADPLYFDFLASESRIESLLSGQSLLQNRKEFVYSYDDSKISPVDGNGILRTGIKSGFMLKIMPSVSTDSMTADIDIRYLDFHGFDSSNNVLSSMYELKTNISVPKDGRRYASVLKPSETKNVIRSSGGSLSAETAGSSSVIVLIIEAIPLSATAKTD